MKRKSVFVKFIYAYIFFGMISFVTVATFTSELFRNYLIKNEAASLYKEATLISSKYAAYFYNDEISHTDIEKQLAIVQSLTESDIYIVNTNGEVIYGAASGENVVIDDFDPSENPTYYTTSDFYGRSEEPVLSVYAVINYNYATRGYVVINKPMSIFNKKEESLLKICLATFFVVFIFSTVVLLVFTDNVYIPLKGTIAAAEEYAKGNLKYTFDVGKDDEMGYLCGQLNYMSDKLSQSEEYQKKFIANVSHDFKSPLTSIKGYIEAMTDGTIPPEMHEKYLNIVLNETERLTKLTGSLLTLNSLNTTGMALDIKPFDINSVIRKTVMTFEGLVREKKIHLSIVLSGNELIVKGDVMKIEQVLYNLLDNAIKFTDADGDIKIETTEKNDTVFVSVKDSGIGIPKESIGHVFDRFYKSDLSRGKDKKGTGLGLSIAKEIITAHEENINVISTEGAGTEFIFTLTKV